MSDNVPVEDQPGYTSVLQRDLEVLAVFSAVSRVRRNVRVISGSDIVSNAVGEGT
jgi:hypothetical protein